MLKQVKFLWESRVVSEACRGNIDFKTNINV
jgi:hypothetical protein